MGNHPHAADSKASHVVVDGTHGAIGELAMADDRVAFGGKSSQSRKSR
jgi:hypothetical protein